MSETTVVVQADSTDGISSSSSSVRKVPKCEVHEVSEDMPSTSGTDIEAMGGFQDMPEWKPQRAEWIIMLSLSTISLMVALDATILVTVLPVSVDF